MKKLILLAACGMLMGCDYTVPLIKTPELAIDPGLVGVWQRTKENGQTERLLVLPFNKQEYLVSFPSGAKDAMFARACLGRSGNQALAQLEWIGTAQGQLAEDRRVFQFAAWSIDGNNLTVRLLNPEVVKKDVSSSEELAKAIAENRDKPDLFRDALVFTKFFLTSQEK